MFRNTPERRDDALRIEIVLTIAALLITTIATVLLFRDVMAQLGAPGFTIPARTAAIVFACLLPLLIYGNVVYLVTRLGYFVRRSRHRSVAFVDVVEEHWASAEPITVLIPSYKEDSRTIRQTLLSAVLQHYPDKRVVLLVDDPQRPQDRASAQLLRQARAMPAHISTMLDQPREIIDRGYRQFRYLPIVPTPSPARAALPLLEAYGELVAWLHRCAADERPVDHIDTHFVEVTFLDHARLLEAASQRLVNRLASGRVEIQEIGDAFRRLSAVFTVEIDVFERKRYVNVSHEANKAANLNTYIGLICRTMRERRYADGLHLEAADPRDTHASMTIPDATYVLTLDADSMIRPDYALRLASTLSAPGNSRVAIVQTPYTAIPDAPGVLERIAGATTNMQYIVHQGFCWLDATYWVGANALLRKQALDDIRASYTERGHQLSRYIQDRTVIEDTESTIDLAARGWRLENVPERLAYSATPPDFGSLLIQRSRWANGGLLIVPNLVRLLLGRRFTAVTIPSFLLRLHYLSSIATSSIALLVLLFLPVDERMFSIWLPVLAAAYFGLYWRDLIQNGYRPGDILRVMAFNLMLLPVNLAGVLKSIQQGVTGKRTPFARTPKVEGRTAAPAWSVTCLGLLFGWSLAAGVGHAVMGHWLLAGFSLTLVLGFGYVIGALVGLRATWEDATFPARTWWERLAGRGGSVPGRMGRSQGT
jgi:cellulose synthase/poly-beta-1,6-N-acetylglucosamine synthase-like glycosyltransferase